MAIVIGPNEPKESFDERRFIGRRGRPSGKKISTQKQKISLTGDEILFLEEFVCALQSMVDSKSSRVCKAIKILNVSDPFFSISEKDLCDLKELMASEKFSVISDRMKRAYEILNNAYQCSVQKLNR